MGETVGQNIGAEQNTCSLEARKLITRMEQLMDVDERFINTIMPTQLAVHLIKTGDSRNFADVESNLRELDSRVYFVAVPPEHYGAENAGERMLCPWNREESPEYVLSVCTGGVQQRDVMLGRLNITPEVNLLRLQYTGVLTS